MCRYELDNVSFVVVNDPHYPDQLIRDIGSSMYGMFPRSNVRVRNFIDIPLTSHAHAIHVCTTILWWLVQ